jgi:NADH:ubiquinone reductase (H+-translocating)
MINPTRQSDRTEASPSPAHHVVIVGAGFAGLALAQSLGSTPLRVTVIDRRNYHLFQPLLYQVATAVLSPGEIAQPIRRILGHHKNITVLLGEVDDISPERKEVYVNGEALTYDTLVLATGATHGYFGHPEWARFAPA